MRRYIDKKTKGKRERNKRNKQTRGYSDMKIQGDKEIQRGRDEWMKGNKWIKRGKL